MLKGQTVLLAMRHMEAQGPPKKSRVQSAAIGLLGGVAFGGALYAFAALGGPAALKDVDHFTLLLALGALSLLSMCAAICAIVHFVGVQRRFDADQQARQGERQLRRGTLRLAAPASGGAQDGGGGAEVHARLTAARFEWWRGDAAGPSARNNGSYSSVPLADIVGAEAAAASGAGASRRVVAVRVTQVVQRAALAAVLDVCLARGHRARRAAVHRIEFAAPSAEEAAAWAAAVCGAAGVAEGASAPAAVADAPTAGVARRTAAALLLFLAALMALNYRALNRPDDGRPAEAVLGVGALAQARRSDVLRLDLPELAQLFRSLGRQPAKVEPQGVFRGEQLPLGVTWLAGAGVITRHGMGVCWGACPEGQSHLGAWAGKWFDGDDQAAGGNLFRQAAPGAAAAMAAGGGPEASVGGPEAASVATKARPFRVVRAHRSELDGRAATLLHYGATDLPLLGVMRDELRCVHADLCVGFGGFSIAGGVRTSGSPFLLTRAGGGAGDAGGASDGGRDEL